MAIRGVGLSQAFYGTPQLRMKQPCIGGFQPASGYVIDSGLRCGRWCSRRRFNTDSHVEVSCAMFFSLEGEPLFVTLRGTSLHQQALYCVYMDLHYLQNVYFSNTPRLMGMVESEMENDYMDDVDQSVSPHSNTLLKTKHLRQGFTAWPTSLCCQAGSNFAGFTRTHFTTRQVRVCIRIRIRSGKAEQGNRRAW